MSVRMGRFGPFVQIGTKDDEEKPRFAGLRPGQKMDSDHARGGAVPVSAATQARTNGRRRRNPANTGRFGPYVKYGAKYVSLKTDDPYTVTHERALEVIREKEIADANRLILDFRTPASRCSTAVTGPTSRTDPQRQDSEGPRPQEPDTRGVPGTVGGSTRTGLRQQVGTQNAKGGAPAKTNGSSATADPPAAATKATRARKKTSAPAPATAPPPMRAAARLAAKGSKAAAKKRAPAETAAAAPPAAKTKRRKS